MNEEINDPFIALESPMKEAFVEIQTMCTRLGTLLMETIPRGKRLSQALMKLEECEFWALSGVSNDGVTREYEKSLNGAESQT